MAGSWAISFAKAMEYGQCVQGQAVTPFSAQELLDCGLTIEKPYACESFSELGEMAISYMERVGLAREAGYPYEMRNTRGRACRDAQGGRTLAKVKRLDHSDPDSVKQVLAKQGPLVLLINSPRLTRSGLAQLRHWAAGPPRADPGTQGARAHRLRQPPLAGAGDAGPGLGQQGRARRGVQQHGHRGHLLDRPRRRAVQGLILYK